MPRIPPDDYLCAQAALTTLSRIFTMIHQQPAYPLQQIGKNSAALDQLAATLTEYGRQVGILDHLAEQGHASDVRAITRLTAARRWRDITGELIS